MCGRWSATCISQRPLLASIGSLYSLLTIRAAESEQKACKNREGIILHPASSGTEHVVHTDPKPVLTGTGRSLAGYFAGEGTVAPLDFWRSLHREIGYEIYGVTAGNNCVCVVSL